MIRALIFDCFGVLYHGSLAHLRELTSPDQWQELEDMRIAYDRGFINLSDYRAGISELVGKTPEEIESIMAADHVRNQPLVERIASLKGQYKIGLLTNVGSGLLDQLFSPEEQKELFDVVVESNKVGMIKPHPEIYEYMAAQLELQPAECVMIDDLESNIDGAKRVGMDGIVYHTLAQLEQDFDRLGVQRA
jgi:glucose-1-phosphatase